MRRLAVGFLGIWALLVAGGLVLAGNQEIADRIAANLRSSGELRNYRIGVRVEDGTATLEGTVANLEQMNAALRIAARTEGVTRVVNRLTVGTVEAAGRTEQANELSAAPAVNPGASVATFRKPAPSEVGTTLQVIPTSAPEPTPALLVPPQASVALQAKPERERAFEPTPQPSAQPQVILVPTAAAYGNRPLPIAYVQGQPNPTSGGYVMPVAVGAAPMVYNQPYLPNYAWPSYAPYPNYATLTYPRQYSPTAWPYIGPFYPYPQVPLGWRRVSLEWHDGWWWLDFDDGSRSKGLLSGLLHPLR
jgi:hypothetical protein